MTVEIKKKVFTVIAVGVFIAAAGVLMLHRLYYSYVTGIVNEQIRQMEIMRDVASSGVVVYFDEIEKTLRRFITANFSADFGIMMERWKNSLPEVEDRILFSFTLDRDGRCETAYPPERLRNVIGKDYSFRDYFKKAKYLGTTEISDIHMSGGEKYGDVEGRYYCVSVVGPVLIKDSFEGVFGLDVNLDIVNDKFISPVKFLKTGHAWITDNNGVIICHPDKSRTGFDFLAKDSDTELKNFMQMVISSENGAGTYVAPGVDGSKTKSFVAYSAINVGTNRWHVIVSMDESELRVNIDALMAKFIFFGAVLASVIFFTTYHVTRLIIDSERNMEKLTFEMRLKEQEHLSEIGKMAAGVAHEIRNPLGAISGFAQFIEMKVEGELKKFCSLIVAETDRLNALITNLLQYTKEVNVDITDFNIRNLIEESFLLLRTDAEKSSIVFKNRVEDRLLSSGRPQVKQVLINLFRNSIEAMPEGGEIICDSEIMDGFFYLKIRDTGRGMDEKTMEKFFRAFYTTKENGTGLGLSISRKVMESLGGSISVESRLNEGTCFTLSFPVGSFATQSRMESSFNTSST